MPEVAIEPRNEESGLEARHKIMALEEAILKVEGSTYGDSDLMPLKHSFGDGVYVREIFIPKGMILTGKIHRHSHPNFLMKGEVIVYTEHEGRQHLKAPLSMISKAGIKRAVYALEDTVWITVHVTDETDLKKIEDYVIAPTYGDLLPAGDSAKQIEESNGGTL
jgi:quercetin dioxygenase-like cupin family protein